LDLSSLPIASSLILLFIVFRTIGKILGAYWGAKLVKADHSIQKYTAGGLLPQAGIVMGLVLSIYNEVQFSEISEVLLATIMGATIINELIGPIAAKYALSKAGEINK
jgi:Kef-type K+ transport system membrane component KefB